MFLAVAMLVLCDHFYYARILKKGYYNKPFKTIFKAKKAKKLKKVDPKNPEQLPEEAEGEGEGEGDAEKPPEEEKQPEDKPPEEKPKTPDAVAKPEPSKSEDESSEGEESESSYSESTPKEPSESSRSIEHADVFSRFHFLLSFDKNIVPNEPRPKDDISVEIAPADVNIGKFLNSKIVNFLANKLKFYPIFSTCKRRLQQRSYRS